MQQIRARLLESLPLAKPGIYDDSSGYLIYFGNWSIQTHPNMYKTTYSYSQAIGDGVEFRFEGTGVNLEYYKQTDQDYGIMDVKLDGRPVAALDMNSDRFEPIRYGRANHSHQVNIHSR